MPLDHYLPATFLAQFSLDDNPRRRDRIISVGDLKTKKVFQSKISNVAAINDFYSMDAFPKASRAVDNSWTSYEAGIAIALQNLIHRKIDANDWLKVLVPFVSGLFSRGPDFNERFSNRVKDIGFESDKTNTNFARILEVNRLLPLIFTAKWIVLNIKGDTPMITNDIGFCFFRGQLNSDIGISIPIGLTSILAVVPSYKRKILKYKKKQWYPIVEYHDLFPDNHMALRSLLAERTNRFIYGPENKIVSEYVNVKQKKDKFMFEPELVGFMANRKFDNIWPQLATLIDYSPSQLRRMNSIDISKNLTWGTIPILSDDLSKPSKAIKIFGNSIVMDLYRAQ